MTETNENPLETLVELFVYAPIGLLYEHAEVLPQLIKRGKSQVQLARVVGQMALKQNVGNKAGPTGQIGQLQVPVDALAGVAAQFITEIGSAIGLAPPKTQEPPVDAEPDGGDETDLAVDRGPSPDVPAHPAPVAPDQIDRLPIARYDDLTAREIIGLLDDLTMSQVARVGNYERAHRARKTVLAKVTRLQAGDV